MSRTTTDDHRLQLSPGREVKASMVETAKALSMTVTEYATEAHAIAGPVLMRARQRIDDMGEGPKKARKGRNKK